MGNRAPEGNSNCSALGSLITPLPPLLRSSSISALSLVSLSSRLLMYCLSLICRDCPTPDSHDAHWLSKSWVSPSVGRISMTRRKLVDHPSHADPVSSIPMPPSAPETFDPCDVRSSFRS